MTERAKPGQTWRVDAGEEGVRLDSFLAEASRLGSRRRAATALSRGQVFVNEREVRADEAGRKLLGGEGVRLWIDRPGSASQRSHTRDAGPLEIVFEDPALLVVNKPAGLLAVPLPRKADEPAATDYIERYLRGRGKTQPIVVHRIDRDTSGLIVIARTGSAAAALKAQFEERTAERIYQTVVYGHPEPASGTWRDHVKWDDRMMLQRVASARDPHGREAVSHYRVVRFFVASALLEVRLETGKRNQIRLQAMLRGHPLVGEQRYVVHTGGEEIPFKRQALHAWKLAFRHPVDGRRLEFEAMVPEDMTALIRRLRRGPKASVQDSGA